MPISNTPKPSTTLANLAKVNIGETWDTDLNTWDAELRTWDGTASTITNQSKTSTTITNTIKPS